MADAFPISGNIDPKAFPFLLMDLHRQGATGSLKVDGPSYPKALYYRAGRILFGSSNDPRDQLGAILIEAGKITPEQLEDVNAKVGPGNPLAKVLADTGFVNQRELSEAARAKVERILSDVIAYTSGSFEFEDGVLPKGAIDLKLSTERVLLAAVRRVSDRAFVLRHLENLDVVLAPSLDKVPAMAELQAETGGLVEQLDGRRTLKEAAGLTRLDEFDAAKVACALMFLGLAARRHEGARHAAAPEPKIELDLGATASAAFAIVPEPTIAIPAASERAAAPSAPETPFFLPDEEPEAVPPIPPPVPPPVPVRAAPPPPAPPSRPVTPLPPIVIPEPEPEPPPVPRPEPTVAMPPPLGETVAPPPSIDATVRLEPPPKTEAPAARATRPGSPTLVYPPNAPVRPRSEPPSRPAASRPSKDDLAALDVLLNPKAHEGPLAPLEAGSRDEGWAPQIGEGRPGGRRPPIALIAGGIAFVVAAVAALWYAFQSPKQVSFPRLGGDRVPSPSARPAPPSTTLAATATTTLAAAPTTLAAATPPPRPLATPAGVAGTPWSLSPAPTTAAVTPRPVATPPPTPVPAPSQTPRPAATPPPPTPAPAAAPTGNPLEQARAALRKGDFPDAARAFAAHLRRAPAGTSTIQLLVACSGDTVQKAVSEVGSTELFIVPVNYKGRDCYRMCWGLYHDASRAASASRSLPEYFRKGGASPRVLAAAEVLP